MTRAYVGLGSNLGDREQAIRNAAETIGATRLSEIRETEPWGYTDQPLFLNAVAEVETESARAARRAARGRAPPRPRARRRPKVRPATIDLDLLLYGNRS